MPTLPQLCAMPACLCLRPAGRSCRSRRRQRSCCALGQRRTQACTAAWLRKCSCCCLVWWSTAHPPHDIACAQVPASCTQLSWSACLVVSWCRPMQCQRAAVGMRSCAGEVVPGARAAQVPAERVVLCVVDEKGARAVFCVSYSLALGKVRCAGARLRSTKLQTGTCSRLARCSGTRRTSAVVRAHRHFAAYPP